MNVKTKQINNMDLMGQYEDVNEYLSQCYNNGLRIPIYVIIIGQSLSKVDWDVLVNYFNDENLYSNIIFCYHESYSSQLLNLYQMLKQKGVDDEVIEDRINKRYYSFHKYSNLQILLSEINTQLDNFVEHRHIDLNTQEEKVLKEIINNQDDLIKGNKYLVSVEGISEDETSNLLENLSEKGYIEIESIPRKLNGPSRPYLIKKILKF